MKISEARSPHRNSRAVAVLFGGKGHEHDVSIAGAKNFIRRALALGYDIIPVYIGKNGDFSILGTDGCEISDKLSVPTFPVRLSGESGFLAGGEIVPVALCVPLLHGDFGEDGVVQGLLSSAGIPFVGADTVSGAVMADKAYSKAIAAEAGVPVLPHAVFCLDGYCERMAADEVEGVIGYPAFVKPCRLGSSVGASLALDRGELLAALKVAFSVSERVMVERALLNKRELECAYFKVEEKKLVCHPGEIVLSCGFYDYGTKYSDKSSAKIKVRADVNSEISERIKAYTELLADRLLARHIARFDYFLTDKGEIYFNEVNSFPGMTSGSLYCAMLRAGGMPYDSFIHTLLGIGGKSS